MRKSRKQPPRLLKKRARFRVAALLVYGTLVAGAGITWIMMAQASSNCADTAPCAESGTPVTANNWTLQFADEFSGAAVDASKWNTGRWQATTSADEPFNVGKEGAYFSTDNVTVGGGVLNLKLVARRQTINGRSYTYSSGEINTQHKFEIKPGDYVEARIKVPKCSGCWPAFWSAPTRGTPPEIDVFEFFNTANHPRPAYNFHAADNSESGPALYGEARADYRNAYHVYGVYWSGSQLTPYLDGKPYPVGGSGNTDIAQYLIFNLSTFANFSPASAVMQIDWVRVWGPPQPTVSLASVSKPELPPLQPDASSAPAPNLPADTSSGRRPAVAQVTAAVATISGAYTIRVPDGTTGVKVLVDGTATTSSRQLNTRWLQNGRHTLTVQTTAANGQAATTTMSVQVANQLNPYEAARNWFFAPFHGNILMVNLAGAVLSTILLAGLGLAWWIIQPHRRTRAIGLAV